MATEILGGNNHRTGLVIATHGSRRTRLVPNVRYRDIADALRMAFWGFVIVANIFILTTIVMMHFGNNSVLYWFMDTTCGACGR